MVDRAIGHIDDQAIDAPAAELGGQRHADRPGADDQDWNAIRKLPRLLDHRSAGEAWKQRLGVVPIDHPSRAVIEPGEAVEPSGFRRDDVIGDVGVVGAEQNL